MHASTGTYRLVAGLLILLAAVPLALMAQRAHAFGPETRLSDTWFKARRRAPRADMVIVARDRKTLDTLGRAPTHADYGAVIRRLKAAGARWIVLDLDLDDRQGRAADRALWTAIEDSHRTLIMVRYHQTRTEVPDRDELRGLRALEKSSHWQEVEIRPGTPEWGWLNFAPATSDFIHSAHGAGVAVTEQSMDPDGVIRRSRAGYVTKVVYPDDAKQGKLAGYVAVVPNLAVITAVSALGSDKYALNFDFGERLSFGGELPQPLDVQGFVPVDYAGPEGTYPRVSMVDVLQDQAPPQSFKDRTVFIGSTIPTDDLTEYRMTPFGSRMPRVEITANETQALLEGRWVTGPHVAGLWAVLFFGVLLALLVPSFRLVGALGSALAALLVYFLIGWVLFGMRSIMLPLLPVLILTPVAIAVAAVLQALMKPYSIARYVEVRDTGMAINPGEDLPGATPRRRFGFRRQRGV